MKTYLLRAPKAVEPQKPARRQRNPSAVEPKAAPNKRPAPTSSAGVSSRGSQPRVLFLGLDVHTESIAVSLAPSDSTEVRRYGLIGGTHDDVLRLAKKLQAAHPGHELRFCYEAGPHGYPLSRFLQSHGYACILVAPSKVPRLPATGSRPTAAMPINSPAFTAPGN